MTREEAIKMLEYIRTTGNGVNPYKHDAQSIAIDIAIEALEQESQTKNEKIYCDRNLCFNYECSTCPVNSSQN